MHDEQRSNPNLAGVRALVLDVDGVLTDGGLWLGPEGAEWKRFSFADIMGLSLARRAGLELALISGEGSPLVDRYATKLHIPFVVKGCRDKASAVRDFAVFAELPLSAVCFMGDDVNDLPAMDLAGYSAAPSSAMPTALQHAGFVTQHAGGNGAVRELVEAILSAKGLTVEQVFRMPVPPLTHSNPQKRSAQ